MLPRRPDWRRYTIADVYAEILVMHLLDVPWLDGLHPPHLEKTVVGSKSNLLLRLTGEVCIYLRVRRNIHSGEAQSWIWQTARSTAFKAWNSRFVGQWDSGTTISSGGANLSGGEMCLC